MDKVTFLTPSVAVTGFMTPKCLRIIKTLGFSSVINMMPTATSVMEDIPEKALASKVRSRGLEYRRLPVNSELEIDQDLIESFKETLEEIPKPAIIFSRTGKNAVSVWACAMQNILTCEELAAIASRAGYEISHPIKDQIPFVSRAA